MTYIFVLELENNKYYVGKTLHPEFHFNKDFTSYAKEWTTKYKPIKIIELVSFSTNYDVDRYVIKYMKKYGMDSVRGGSFYSFELDIDTRRVLVHMINNQEIDKYTDDMNNLLVNEATEELGEFIKSDYENDPKKLEKILNKIENDDNLSTKDLDEFMDQVLDESRNYTLEINPELTIISPQCNDIFNGTNNYESSDEDIIETPKNNSNEIYEVEMNESKTISEPINIYEPTNVYNKLYDDEVEKIIDNIVINNNNKYCTCILSKLFNHKKCIKYYLGYGI
jgi:hypothetical protein